MDTSTMNSPTQVEPAPSEPCNVGEPAAISPKKPIQLGVAQSSVGMLDTMDTSTMNSPTQVEPAPSEPCNVGEPAAISPKKPIQLGVAQSSVGMLDTMDTSTMNSPTQVEPAPSEPCNVGEPAAISSKKPIQLGVAQSSVGMRDTMDTSTMNSPTQVEPAPSEPCNVGEPAAISPKKPIQLGVVQSSVGMRGTSSSSTKKSRWDQGPGPGEVESDSTVEQSQSNENFNSVKDLVKKFEGISESSRASNETGKVEEEEKGERSQLAVSPIPTRVKLVRTNFVKTEKSEKPINEGSGIPFFTSLSEQNETTTVETKTEKETEKSEVELKSISKSKALQIISCNYDSETEESSQECDFSSAPNDKNPADATSFDKLGNVPTSTECKEKPSGAIITTESNFSDQLSDARTGCKEKLSDAPIITECEDNLSDARTECNEKLNDAPINTECEDNLSDARTECNENLSDAPINTECKDNLSDARTECNEKLSDAPINTECEDNLSDARTECNEKLNDASPDSESKGILINAPMSSESKENLSDIITDCKEKLSDDPVENLCDVTVSIKHKENLIESHMSSETTENLSDVSTECKEKLSDDLVESAATVSIECKGNLIDVPMSPESTENLSDASFECKEKLSDDPVESAATISIECKGNLIDTPVGSESKENLSVVRTECKEKLSDAPVENLNDAPLENLTDSTVSIEHKDNIVDSPMSSECKANLSADVSTERNDNLLDTPVTSECKENLSDTSRDCKENLSDAALSNECKDNLSDTTVSSTCQENLIDAPISSECKDNIDDERSLKVAVVEKETKTDVDTKKQCEENTKPTSSSQIDHNKDDREHSNKRDRNRKSTSEHIACDLKQEKIKSVDNTISEKSVIGRDSLGVSSLSEFYSENLVSDDLTIPDDNLEEKKEGFVKTKNIDQDYIGLNEEINNKKVKDKTAEEIITEQIANIDSATAYNTESIKKSDEVDSCVTKSPTSKPLLQKFEITVDEKVDPGKGSDEFSIEISQSDKSIKETENFSEPLISTKHVVINTDDEHQDWVMVSHEDVKEMISEDPTSSKRLDTLENLDNSNPDVSGDGIIPNNSNNSEMISSCDLEERRNLKQEEGKLIPAGNNNELEIDNEGDLNDNLKSPNKDYQTNDNLTESSCKYDKVDETMEEIFSDNIGSSSIPEVSEKESNDEETNSLESEKMKPEITSFEGIIGTDKKEGTFEKQTGLADLETKETLLEMLESDNSPITTAVIPTPLSNKKPSSPLSADTSVSRSVHLNAQEIMSEADITNVQILTETDLVKSISSTLTTLEDERSNIYKHTCDSKEPIMTNLKVTDSQKTAKELAPSKTVEFGCFSKNETQSEKERLSSSKDVTFSKSLIESEIITNKFDDKNTVGKLVKETEMKDIETELPEKEKVSTDIVLEEDDNLGVQVFDSENVLTKGTGDENVETDEIASITCMESNAGIATEEEKEIKPNETTSLICLKSNTKVDLVPSVTCSKLNSPIVVEDEKKLETDFITNVTCSELNPSTVAENVKMLSTDEIKSSIVIDTIGIAEKTSPTDMITKISGRSEEDVQSNDYNVGNRTSNDLKNNDINNKVAHHTSDEDHVLPTDSPAQNTNDLQKSDIVKIDNIELLTEGQEGPDKCLDRSKTDSELIISDTKDVSNEESKKILHEEKLISTTIPVVDRVKSEEFSGIIDRKVTNTEVAETLQESEHVQIEVANVPHLTTSTVNKLSLGSETENSKSTAADLLATSKVDYSGKKENSTDIIVESEQISKDDFGKQENTMILNVENEPPQLGDKTENNKIPEPSTELDSLKECDVTSPSHKNKDPHTKDVLKGDINVGYSKQDTSLSEINEDSLNKQIPDEKDTATTNENLSKLSNKVVSESEDKLLSISKDFPIPGSSNLPNVDLSEGTTQIELTHEPSPTLHVEALEKDSSPSAEEGKESSKTMAKPAKMSDEAIIEPLTEIYEKTLESVNIDISTDTPLERILEKVDSVSTLDSSEPETVEAIDSFLKQTVPSKKSVELVKPSSGPPTPDKSSANVLCETKEKKTSNANTPSIEAIENNLICKATKQPNTISVDTSSRTEKDDGSSFETVKEDNHETDSANKDIKKSKEIKNILKLNIAQVLAASSDVSKQTTVQTIKDVEVREKPVEPLKLKLKKTDFEVYSPKRSESPLESSKSTLKKLETKPVEKIASAGIPDLGQNQEIAEPKPTEKSVKVDVSNHKSGNEETPLKQVISAEESTTLAESKPSAPISATSSECISKIYVSEGAVEKLTSDGASTPEESSTKANETDNVGEDKERGTVFEPQTKRPFQSKTDGNSDSTDKSSRKKLKRSQIETKNVDEEDESLIEDTTKEEISPVPSQTTLPSQVPELEVKSSPKATPKEVPPPVRVSARQKQRQAAALAAEEKSKEVKTPVESVTKKTSQEKGVDKKTKKSVSPTKEIGLKTLFVKTTEAIKQPLITGEKSPKLLENKSPSPLSPKKVSKELGQVKLEPITLKLSKEDNPVIIRSSSLSPKKVSPHSPQQKSLGYTLKIGKDSTTIVPKDPSHSPKLKDASPSAGNSKADLTNKVGYLIKDTGLTITPVSSSETQEQKLNKITLKLSKAGGHPEIKQEKAETWKAIKKLGDVDIVPMEGKVSAESFKRKEKSDQGSSEKKMKLRDLTVEPSTSSGLSKLQGLLTQAPLNKAESSEDIQFVGFGSPAEPVDKVQYDIGLVKPEDELALPKKRGRPRKITSPSDMVHSVTHSGLAGSKSILAASLQHQTVQQQLQIQEPQPDADSSIPMFPVPLFDLSEDTFMEPHPTIFPEQVQPETIIMRSARGRPIGRSRRSRGSGLSRGERGGPRGRPRGSRGIKKILEEMEFLSYPDMEQPITLDNIDAEIPRILEPPVSHITEKTMALLRKSIECKKESLEKKRRSDGSDSDNKDSELDAKVKEMKEKIEAAYKAELESPGKEDKEVTKITPEKVEVKEKVDAKDKVETKEGVISPEPIPSTSSDTMVQTASDRKGFKRKSTEEKAPFHGIGKDILKRKLSGEKFSEKRIKRKSTDEISGGRKSTDKIEGKKLKVSPVVEDEKKQARRKTVEEKPESTVEIESKQDESSKPTETTDILSEKLDVNESKEDTVVKESEEMEVDKPSVTEQPTEVEKQADAEPEVAQPEQPAKPVKPKPKSKAEIKRIKREKDRLRREAKKLAALEALKAPPPNPSEEDTRMSASDVNGDGMDDGFGFKKNRMEVGDAEGKEFCVEYIAEYQWPLQGGELYMIQEQISTYLGVKSFKRKYPDIKRRPVEMEERTYLCDSGLVSESMCDLGLTAVSSSEVLDIMFQDFPDQYEELRKNMRDKAARELINKQKEKKKFEQSLSKSDLKEHAIQSAQSWNQAMNRSRNESRRCHLDLQTWTVQYPRSRGAKMTRPTPKLGNYPLALIPGQYSDYCKRYTPQELRYWPINTVLYGPLQPNERNSTAGGSDGSQSESEDSSSSEESSGSSSDGEGTEEEERDCKVCGGGRKAGDATVRCSQCAHHSTTATVWA